MFRRKRAIPMSWFPDCVARGCRDDDHPDTARLGARSPGLVTLPALGNDAVAALIEALETWGER